MYDEYSQQWEVYTIITAEQRLATLYELQTIYSTKDVYDLLETLQVFSTLKEEAEKESNK